MGKRKIDIDKLLQLREQGLTHKEIAKILGVSHQAISQSLLKGGIKGSMYNAKDSIRHLHKFKCNMCPKEFLSPYKNQVSYDHIHRFCSLKCQKEYRNPKPIYIGLERIEIPKDKVNRETSYLGSKLILNT